MAHRCPYYFYCMAAGAIASISPQVQTRRSGLLGSEQPGLHRQRKSKISASGVRQHAFAHRQASYLRCSVVSLFLVVSCPRLVIGLRVAAVEAATAQFLYLILFSYEFFHKGFTGLAAGRRRIPPR
jgi:hypothetical protein